MKLFARRNSHTEQTSVTHNEIPYIEIIEPESTRDSTLSPEGNIKLKNYRLVGPGTSGLRAYTPTGDVNTTPIKRKLVSRFDKFDNTTTPRQRILDLIKADEPGNEALEEIVRPAVRRAPSHSNPEHISEDAWKFLQRALMSPSPTGLSTCSPEPCDSSLSPVPPEANEHNTGEERRVSINNSSGLTLADELLEAESLSMRDGDIPKDNESLARKNSMFKEYCERDLSQAAEERDIMAKMALSVEEDELPEEVSELADAARRLDQMLAESRDLHDELTEIHDDMQAEERRAAVCVMAAKALEKEARALNFLDDVLTLLRGDDVVDVLRSRGWPFSLGCARNPKGNYIV